MLSPVEFRGYVVAKLEDINGDTKQLHKRLNRIEDKHDREISSLRKTITAMKVKMAGIGVSVTIATTVLIKIIMQLIGGST